MSSSHDQNDKTVPEITRLNSQTNCNLHLLQKSVIDKVQPSMKIETTSANFGSKNSFCGCLKK